MESTDAGAVDESVAGRVRWGMALNMLEPPAIALTIGMAMAREPLHLPEVQLWKTFGLLVAPLMLAAACGESLWMGVTPGFGSEGRTAGSLADRPFLRRAATAPQPLAHRLAAS